MIEVRVALCDDDPTWLVQAERILRDFANQADVSLALSSFTDGASLLLDSSEPPDVLFCDIELSEGKSGINLVRDVARIWPRCQIVYVTNFLRYAPDVYVTEHLWFVTKDRFEECLPEVVDKIERKLDDATRSLAVHTIDHADLRLPCLEIVCLERRGRETIVTRMDGTTCAVRERLPELLERLPRRMFVRCHGSFALNLEHVRKLGADMAELSGGASVPVSRRYLRSVRDAYLDWLDDHAM